MTKQEAMERWFATLIETVGDEQAAATMAAVYEVAQLIVAGRPEIAVALGALVEAAAPPSELRPAKQVVASLIRSWDEASS